MGVRFLDVHATTERSASPKLAVHNPRSVRVRKALDHLSSVDRTARANAPGPLSVPFGLMTA